MTNREDENNCGPAVVNVNELLVASVFSRMTRLKNYISHPQEKRNGREQFAWEKQSIFP